jgi:aminopeptidase N
MRLVVFVMFFLVLSNVFSQHQQELQEIINTEKKAFEIGLKNASVAEDRSYFDVVSQTLDLTANPDTQFIAGKVTTHFVVLKSGVNSIVLDLSSTLTLDSVKSQELITWKHQNNRIEISYTSPLSQKTKYELELYYHGSPEGGRAFTTDSVKDGKVLWTLSEPYGAMEWWPCKQDLQDKIESLTIHITHPDSLTAVANGLKTNEVPLPNNFKRTSFQHNYPVVSYLVAFAVSKYEVLTDTIAHHGKKLPFVNYVYPSSKNEAIRDLQNFDKTLFLFDSLFGEYPFSKELYGHAQFSWGGGMEHQTMSFMYNFNHSLVAHELAHQWFGDQITCGSWQDLWLNEGFATYLTGLSYEALFRDEVWFNWKNQTLKAATSRLDGSVWIEDTTDVARMFSSALTYNKGAYLLHMLRWKMGDDAFFKAIRNYLNDKKLSYNFARTDDLIFHLKQTNDADIDEFFNDYFYGKGWPSYTIKWYQSQDYTLYLVVEQELSFGWQNVFFDMDLPFWVLGNGLDTNLRLTHTQARQEFVIPLDKPIVDLLFDPNLWLLSGNNTVERVDYEHELIGYKIAPNPVKDQLKVFASGANLPSTNLKIFNLSGQQVWSGKAPQGISSNGFYVDVAHLQKGLYLLHVEDYFSTTVLRFVKQ